MSNVRRIRPPLTIAQLRLAADNGTLTPQDLLQISWIRTARTIRLPNTRAEELVAEFASYIREWRVERGMLVKDLAAIAGIHHTRLSQIENNIVKTISLDQMLNLAAATGSDFSIVFHPKKRSRRAKAA